MMVQRQSPINYPEARATLDGVFKQVESRHLAGEPEPPCPPGLEGAFDVLFASETQAHREVLVGCAIARLQDRTINIRHTYMKHGSDAFNGRSLDGRVVNQFLRENRIPCTKGPYLSASEQQRTAEVAVTMFLSAALWFIIALPFAIAAIATIAKEKDTR